VVGAREAAARARAATSQDFRCTSKRHRSESRHPRADGPPPLSDAGFDRDGGAQSLPPGPQQDALRRYGRIMAESHDQLCTENLVGALRPGQMLARRP
jgi:hypothetical protein